MTKKTSPAYRASKEETIPINKLHPFSNHPFHIRHDLEFSELVDSISESGIITPIIVRPKVGVGYEVISGHRRWEACKELGIESIPARVEYIDDDEATILMVNSNIQREHVLPSEKAFAYKMRMEALKHQGRATLGQVVPKLKYNRSEAVIGEEVGESYKQVQRYIRLTYLIPSILQMVDDGRIAFNPAVEISYMTGEHQTWLKEEMEMCDATPSLVQSRTLKDMSRNGTLTENYLHTLLTEEKPNQRQKFFLNQSDVQQYFPSNYTPQQIHPNVLTVCKQKKILYQTSFKDHPNCVFVGRDGNGEPKGGSLRGCSQIQFRRDIPGSKKIYPFYIEAAATADTVEVYEAPIDAMSGASLKIMQHTGNWRDVHYLALGGTDYAALDAFLTYYPNITHIVLCLDNDEAGRTRTQDIIKHLEGNGKTVEDRPPTIGKDYNDTLVQVTQEYQKHCISLDDILEETR